MRRRGQVDTIRVSDELNVDIAPDGTVYGIELLNANAQIQAEDGGGFVVVDEGAGRMQELPLAVHERPAAYKAPRRPKR